MNQPANQRKSILTPFNIISALILVFGFAVIVIRFWKGLGATTNVDHTTPWGLWTGFKMAFVALAAGGFTLTTAVYIFKMEEYHDLVRPAVLSGFIGYTLFILILVFDLGRAWRIYYPFLIQPGPTSALFEIALCVALYYTTQFLELTPVGFEWLGWRKWRKVMIAATVGFTIFGLLLSTLHQSTLGALYLITPTKLHPLWYSTYIPLHFFLTAVAGGISMVIFVGIMSKRVFGHKMEISRERLDRLTVGLGKGGAIALAVYFSVKFIDVSLADNWHYIATPMGLWYLVEMLGFVLLPCIIYGIGYRESRPGLIRVGSLITILGIILNRVNVGVIAFNWHVPAAERYYPHWMEYVVVITLITLGLVAFKVVSHMMPIVNEHPNFKGTH
jgi:Ni/Fe-hydrogenase subunit HybB-like protein